MNVSKIHRKISKPQSICSMTTLTKTTRTYFFDEKMTVFKRKKILGTIPCPKKDTIIYYLSEVGLLPTSTIQNIFINQKVKKKNP